MTIEDLLGEAVEAANVAHRNFIKVATEFQEAARGGNAVSDELRKKYAAASKVWIEAGRLLDQFNND